MGAAALDHETQFLSLARLVLLDLNKLKQEKYDCCAERIQQHKKIHSRL